MTHPDDGKAVGLGVVLIIKKSAARAPNWGCGLFFVAYDLDRAPQRNRAGNRTAWTSHFWSTAGLSSGGLQHLKPNCQFRFRPVAAFG